MAQRSITAGIGWEILRWGPSSLLTAPGVKTITSGKSACPNLHKERCGPMESAAPLTPLSHVIPRGRVKSTQQ